MMIGNISMLPGMAEYPRDAWYVAAFSREVERKPLLREICGQPVVFYRTEAGEPVALFGRCPHRGMAMDKGPVIGDRVQCGYHGFEYDASGKCVFVPSGGTIPSGLALKRFPLIEIAGWIWIWPGNPAKADPKLLPDHEYLGMTAPGYESEPGVYLHFNCNYLLPLENLADATHITYLHHGLADTGNVAAQPFWIEAEGNVVKIFRRFENEPISPMIQRSMNVKGRVNRTMELTTIVPSIVLVKMSFVPADNPNAPEMVSSLAIAVTPENDKGAHQFHANAGTVLSKYEARFDDMYNLLHEDVVAADEIQQIFDKLGPQNAPEFSVKADEGAIRVRRIIADMIVKERQSALAAE